VTVGGGGKSESYERTLLRQSWGKEDNSPEKITDEIEQESPRKKGTLAEVGKAVYESGWRSLKRRHQVKKLAALVDRKLKGDRGKKQIRRAKKLQRVAGSSQTRRKKKKYRQKEKHGRGRRKVRF